MDVCDNFTVQPEMSTRPNVLGENEQIKHENELLRSHMKLLKQNNQLKICSLSSMLTQLFEETSKNGNQHSSMEAIRKLCQTFRGMLQPSKETGMVVENDSEACILHPRRSFSDSRMSASSSTVASSRPYSQFSMSSFASSEYGPANRKATKQSASKVSLNSSSGQVTRQQGFATATRMSRKDKARPEKEISPTCQNRKIRRWSRLMRQLKVAKDLRHILAEAGLSKEDYKTLVKRLTEEQGQDSANMEDSKKLNKMPEYTIVAKALSNIQNRNNNWTTTDSQPSHSRTLACSDGISKNTPHEIENVRDITQNSGDCEPVSAAAYYSAVNRPATSDIHHGPSAAMHSYSPASVHHQDATAVMNSYSPAYAHHQAPIAVMHSHSPASVQKHSNDKNVVCPGNLAATWTNTKGNTLTVSGERREGANVKTSESWKTCSAVEDVSNDHLTASASEETLSENIESATKMSIKHKSDQVTTNIYEGLNHEPSNTYGSHSHVSSKSSNTYAGYSQDLLNTTDRHNYASSNSYGEFNHVSSNVYGVCNHDSGPTHGRFNRDSATEFGGYNNDSSTTHDGFNHVSSNACGRHNDVSSTTLCEFNHDSSHMYGGRNHDSSTMYGGFNRDSSNGYGGHPSSINHANVKAGNLSESIGRYTTTGAPNPGVCRTDKQVLVNLDTKNHMYARVQAKSVNDHIQNINPCAPLHSQITDEHLTKSCKLCSPPVAVSRAHLSDQSNSECVSNKSKLRFSHATDNETRRYIRDDLSCTSSSTDCLDTHAITNVTTANSVNTQASIVNEETLAANTQYRADQRGYDQRHNAAAAVDSYNSNVRCTEANFSHHGLHENKPTVSHRQDLYKTSSMVGAESTMDCSRSCTPDQEFLQSRYAPVRDIDHFIFSDHTKATSSNNSLIESGQPISLEAFLRGSKPTRRLMGEIAYQLDRRILHFVFWHPADQDIHKKKAAPSSHHFYGFTMKNIKEKIEEECTDDVTGKINIVKRLRLYLRYDQVMAMLAAHGYCLKQHATLSTRLVNRYGLMALIPAYFSTTSLVSSRKPLLASLLQRVAPPNQLSNILILLDCLTCLAQEDGRPLILW